MVVGITRSCKDAGGTIRWWARGPDDFAHQCSLRGSGAVGKLRNHALGHAKREQRGPLAPGPHPQHHPIPRGTRLWCQSRGIGQDRAPAVSGCTVATKHHLTCLFCSTGSGRMENKAMYLHTFSERENGSVFEEPFEGRNLSKLNLCEDGESGLRVRLGLGLGGL